MCVSLPFKQHEEYILLGAEVLHRGCPGANLTPQDVVEDLSHIFLTLVVTERTHKRVDEAESHVYNTGYNTDTKCFHNTNCFLNLLI